MEHGATLVVYSATKFIGGHGNAIGGAILDSGNFDFSRFPTIAAPSPSYHNLRFFDTFGHYGFLMKARAETVRDVGACVSPMKPRSCSFKGWRRCRCAWTGTWPTRRGSPSSSSRTRTSRGSPTPACRADADHKLAQKYLPKGPGRGLLLRLKGDGAQVREDGKKFIEALELFSHLANVGDARSLVIHPASTTQPAAHRRGTGAMRRGTGNDPTLSVGLENVEDLIWDLEQAFHALSRSTRA